MAIAEVAARLGLDWSGALALILGAVLRFELASFGEDVNGAIVPVPSNHAWTHLRALRKAGERFAGTGYPDLFKRAAFRRWLDRQAGGANAAARKATADQKLREGRDWVLARQAGDQPFTRVADALKAIRAKFGVNGAEARRIWDAAKQAQPDLPSWPGPGAPRKRRG